MKLKNIKATVKDSTTDSAKKGGVKLYVTA